ncbi:hypothetical protein [Pseudomonas paraveronii]|uniref:hypothetical protein n=1 Tax=Pseudomonas paraveronii TaxID=3040598 RepID=UPI002AB2C88E|nr:hypothetical protein [Pseudomonas sp. V3/K/3/5]
MIGSVENMLKLLTSGIAETFENHGFTQKKTVFLKKTDNNTPDEFFTARRIGISLGLFESLLGVVEWVDDQTIRLFQVNKRDYWEIDTTSKEVRFHFPRAESGDAHGQFDLGKMYVDG